MKTEEQGPVEKINAAAKLVLMHGPVENVLQAMLDSCVKWMAEAVTNPGSFTSLREARETILFVLRVSPKLARPEHEDRKRELEQAAALLPDISGSLHSILRAHDALVMLHEILVGPRQGGGWIPDTVDKTRWLLDEVARLVAIIDSVSDTNSILGKNAKLVKVPRVSLPGGTTLVPLDQKLSIGVVFAGGWHACSGPVAQVLNLESWATQEGEAYLMQVVAQRLEALWISANSAVRSLFREEDPE